MPFAPNSAVARVQRGLRRLFGVVGVNAAFQALAVFGYPLYLCFGLPGKMAWVSHFIPWNRAVYPTAKLKLQVVLNTLLYALWLALVIDLSRRYFFDMLFLFILPTLVVNFWLIFYTLHHHISADLPWYDEASWTPSKGAFAVVDRAYWLLINLLHHNIGRYHVFHHINSTIPHYYGAEITALIKAAYPQYYREDRANPFLRAWQTGRHGLILKRIDNHHYWLS